MVRDYECDLQGIVNHAVYLNYFEHARHEYINALGVTFKEQHDAGFDLVVFRIEVDYKKSLQSGDSFSIHSQFHQLSPIRYLFSQDIICDTHQMVHAEIQVVCTSEGKPCTCPAILQLFKPTSIK